MVIISIHSLQPCRTSKRASLSSTFVAHSVIRLLPSHCQPTVDLLQSVFVLNISEGCLKLLGLLRG
jgi:hypothetical protein